MFSNAERDRRFKAADDMMKKEGLSALVMLGNGAVGTNSYGAFRYLVDNRTFYYIQVAIFVPGKEPISLASTIISQLEFQNKSFVTNCRVAPNPIKGIIDTLNEMGVTTGKVGTILDILPTSWLLPLEKAFPNIEWVDVADAVFDLRQHHSAEEVATFRKAAELADIGFKAVCDTIKPGMTEQEVVAELEFATLNNGGEYNFTLISSGRFAIKDNKLPFIHAATMFDKKIEKGDSVALEVTPRCNGYWGQLVRTISVGEANEDLQTLHDVVVGSIKDVLPVLKPGNPISAIPKRIRSYVENLGYTSGANCGHICGCDLNEERLDITNERILLPGMAVIIHPSIFAPGMTSSIFWGETYLITEEGCERLMKTGDELPVIL